MPAAWCARICAGSAEVKRKLTHGRREAVAPASASHTEKYLRFGLWAAAVVAARPTRSGSMLKSWERNTTQHLKKRERKMRCFIHTTIRERYPYVSTTVQ
jgi:hypothetical protein